MIDAFWRATSRFFEMIMIYIAFEVGWCEQAFTKRLAADQIFKACGIENHLLVIYGKTTSFQLSLTFWSQRGIVSRLIPVVEVQVKIQRYYSVAIDTFSVWSFSWGSYM